MPIICPSNFHVLKVVENRRGERLRSHFDFDTYLFDYCVEDVNVASAFLDAMDRRLWPNSGSSSNRGESPVRNRIAVVQLTRFPRTRTSLCGRKQRFPMRPGAAASVEDSRDPDG